MTGTELSTEDGGNRRRRFIAPLRGDVEPRCFDHTLFAEMQRWRGLMLADAWPDIEALNAQLEVPGKRFVTQNETLLADGLHYEQRIAAGDIATRTENWHDLFNAMVWARWPAIKHALNTRQCAAIATMGIRQRNHAQAALTQFDETGVIVRVRDAALLKAWDVHEWQALFMDNAVHWRSGAIGIAAVIGHALMEQALLPGRLLVGKCLVVQGDDDEAGVAAVADAIVNGDVLQQPSELRPLPLAGIPDWHAQQDACFYQQAEYFRPLREGRSYPAPLSPACS